jgi:parvulin-like peptidyl-prolyl isomerase
MAIDREGSIRAGPLPAELEEVVVEAAIERRLLAIEADRLGVRASTTAVAGELRSLEERMPEDRFRRYLIETYQTEAEVSAAIAERLRASALLHQEALRTLAVGDGEIRKAWDALPADARIRPARVRASQIVVATEEAATAVLKRLRKKPAASFADVARAESIAPEGAAGGEVGWFEKGTMPPVFDVCFTLPIGEVSEVTPSELGFHIFAVHEREDAREKTFDEARAGLSESLLEEKVRVAERAFLERLRSRYRVVRHEDLIAKARE